MTVFAHKKKVKNKMNQCIWN